MRHAPAAAAATNKPASSPSRKKKQRPLRAHAAPGVFNKKQGTEEKRT
jgi:hypothetical protein